MHSNGLHYCARTTQYLPASKVIVNTRATLIIHGIRLSPHLVLVFRMISEIEIIRGLNKQPKTTSSSVAEMLLVTGSTQKA